MPVPASPAPVPFLHVLIPAYGRAELLAQALGSAGHALGADLAAGRVRVTVVDDATPGDSVRQACAPFEWCEYARNDVNLGVAGNFAASARLAAGRYVCFAGSDDLFLPGFVDAVRAMAGEHDEPEVIAPPVRVVGADGHTRLSLVDRVKQLIAPPATSAFTLHGDRGAARLLVGDFLYFPSLAWRADALRRHPFDCRFSISLDLDLLLRVLFDGGRITVGAGAPVFEYRRHDGSASSVAAARAGCRYREEMTVHREAARRASALGWSRSAMAARLAVTVRAHRALALAGLA